MVYVYSAHWGHSPFQGPDGNDLHTQLAAIDLIVRPHSPRPTPPSNTNTDPFLPTYHPLFQIRKTYTLLSSIPNTLPIVRTSYPGEVDCFNYTVPYTSTASSNIHHHGWEKMPMINELLVRNMPLLDGEEVEGEEGRRGGEGKAVLMDVERQGQLRPDARLSPKGGDCLHSESGHARK